MNEMWSAIARRAAAGLGVEAGELILVRDRAGRANVVRELLLAVEEKGATPLPELVNNDYLQRLVRTVSVAHLATWDRHRIAWMRQEILKSFQLQRSCFAI